MMDNLIYYTTQAWYERRDAVRQRVHGRCELCRWRPMFHVHHRTYARFGNEPLAHLMAVCGACHQAIHGRWSVLTCAVGSLLDRGDNGTGMTAPWEAYLATTDTLGQF